jgi:hypothetical protein
VTAWRNQVAMKFELEESLRGASDEELLEDMRRCAKAIGRDTITMAEYEGIGKAHPCTTQRRFGSWSNALKLAGLQPGRTNKTITDEELFENLKSLWISLGRQPRRGEVKLPSSLFHACTYVNRFGTWPKALKAFVAWVNSDPPEQDPQEEAGSETVDSTIQKATPKRRTRREISERQRFRVLVRDGFRCGTCGASPLTQRGIELHVDHIVPWSKGGETTDDNLETKCKRCNLGKGNAFER